jgi:outer membrane receptor for ferrienterochelin and colicin
LQNDNGQDILDPDTGEPYSISFDPRGVHVGDAAQIQVGSSVRYEYKKNLYVKLRWTYFDKFYANINPEDLVGPNAGRDSWRVPAYHLFDLHAGYNFKFKGARLNLRGSVFNLLDALYIADARNNDPFATIPLQNFDASSATVFFGQGRRFNLSLTANF